MAESDPGDHRKPRAPRPTYREVQRALDEMSVEILRQIRIERVTLFMPVDGKGARICASVEPPDLDRVPSTVEVRLGRRRLEIPVEARGDYEAFRAR